LARSQLHRSIRFYQPAGVPRCGGAAHSLLGTSASYLRLFLYRWRNVAAYDSTHFYAPPSAVNAGISSLLSSVLFSARTLLCQPALFSVPTFLHARLKAVPLSSFGVLATQTGRDGTRGGTGGTLYAAGIAGVFSRDISLWMLQAGMVGVLFALTVAS